MNDVKKVKSAAQAIANKKLVSFINYGGAVSLVEEALAEGADPRVTNAAGHSVLSQSIRLGKHGLYTMLFTVYPEMAREPLPEINYVSPLFYACAQGGQACIQSLKVLLPLSDLDLRDQMGRSIMHKAVVEKNEWYWKETCRIVTDIANEYGARGRGMDGAIELIKSLGALDESDMRVKKLALPPRNKLFRVWLDAHAGQAMDKARVEEATPLAKTRGRQLRV